MTDQYKGFLFVRIHPVDRGSKHLCERYTHDRRIYRVDRGWYKVSEELGNELRKIRSNDYSRDFVYVFQVFTYDEAQKIVKEELMAQDPRRSLADAVADTMDSVTSVDTVPEEKTKKKKKILKKVSKKKKKINASD